VRKFPLAHPFFRCYTPKIALNFYEAAVCFVLYAAVVGRLPVFLSRSGACTGERCVFLTPHASSLSAPERGSVGAVGDALSEARELQLAAAKVGFDWPDVRGAMTKLREETNELDAALAGGTLADIREELGDLMFSVVNVSRFAAVDVTDALCEANEKFSVRFTRLREEITRRGRRLEDCTLEELDSVWNAIKG
jgi:NTP pyrophosphatase (non-canonical NTP hydrolase)